MKNVRYQSVITQINFLTAKGQKLRAPVLFDASLPWTQVINSLIGTIIDVFKVFLEP